MPCKIQIPAIASNTLSLRSAKKKLDKPKVVTIILLLNYDKKKMLFFSNCRCYFTIIAVIPLLINNEMKNVILVYHYQFTLSCPVSKTLPRLYSPLI
jgi:uncharacterized protein YbaR (Trm112 family)